MAVRLVFPRPVLLPFCTRVLRLLRTRRTRRWTTHHFEERNMTQNTIDNRTTRRAFLGGTAALAASSVLPRGAFGDAADKPNSVFNGVRVGCITYSYRGGPNTAEYTLDCLLKDGLSETELMDGPIRSFAGITGGGGGRGRGKGDKGGKDAQKTAPPPVSNADRAKLREAQL